MRAERHLHALLHHAIHDPDARDGAAVPVEVRVEDQRAQRGVFLPPRRRHPRHQRLEQLGDARALLRRHGEDLFPLRPDQVHDLLRALLGLGAGQVDLVEDRDDLEPGVERQEEVGERLRLDALRRVHDEDGALARVERAGHLVREVDVTGGIDQVELVLDAVPGRVEHPDGVQLDRDATLALEVQGVQDLLAHLALLDGAGLLDEPVGQGGLPVVDVRDDAEIADAGLGHSPQI
jgi:hypothetical protein